jgi:hypothetical protein
MSPSKQGKYDHEIYVITDSPMGKEFKKWLYWENTFCLDGVRGKVGPGLRRYNGQVIAPVVLLWVTKKLQGYSNTNESESQRVRDDAIISATMAMIAAEELGLRTGFNGCLGTTEIEQKLKLDIENKTPAIAVGMGYALHERRITRQVFENNFTVTPYPNDDPKEHPEAYELILKNKDFITYEATAWINYQISNGIEPFLGYQYDSSKCQRDLHYVISSFLHDLQFDTIDATKQTITNYWIKKVLQVRGPAEKATHNFIADLIKNCIFTNVESESYQKNIPQYLNKQLIINQKSIDLMNDLFLSIQNGLDGIGLLPEVGFDYANTMSSIRTGPNRKNRPPIENMIKYI